MKKYIYSLLVLATSMVACTEDYTDWQDPQHNDQPEQVTFGNGSVSAVGLIDLANLAEGQEVVKVCNVVAPTASNAAYDKISYKLVLENATYDLSKDGEITVDELKTYVESNYGKAPEVREIQAVVQQWISNGVTSVRTESSDPFFIKAKLVAPYISDHYYVIGAPSEWDPACTSLPFNHSGANVYDDPVFTVSFAVGEGETWFAITDEKTLESGQWSDVLGCAEGNGNNGAEGFIKRRCDLSDDGSWKITADVESTVKMTINMMDYSYKIEIIPMSAFYYVVGGVQGWSDSNRTHLFMPTENAKEFSYTTKWSGAWDLKVWSADNFGNWDNTIGCAVDGCADATGELIFSGAQAISAPTAEFYTFTINLATNTYTWTRLDDQEPVTYEAIGLIGGFNGWGGDVDMEQVCDHNWYVETTIGEDTELKFRANHDWGVNWGAEIDLATQNFSQGVGNGPNIAVPAGTYRFYLNDITGKLAIVPVE